jgi:ParB/RepB/Spo0J family partition protein
MAVGFETKGDVTRGHVYYFEPSDIELDADNNGRHDLPDIAGLIASIKANGQLQPCIVRKDGKRAKLIAGYSRWRAVVEINKERKPADRLKLAAVYTDANEIDAIMMAYEENASRNSLTPVDHGYMISRMMKGGKSIDDVATAIRQDVSWVKTHLALVNLVPEAQAAVSNGTIKPSAAKALSKLAAAEQRRAMTERDTKGRVTSKSIKASQPADERERFANVTELRQAIADALKLLGADDLGVFARNAADITHEEIGDARELLKSALAKAKRPA